MASRLNLHEELCTILGTRNAYYNPPESLRLQYDCVVYSRSGIDSMRADNRNYVNTNQYTLVVMSKSPSCDIPEKILEHFPMASFDRQYTSDELYHFIITLYY